MAMTMPRPAYQGELMLAGWTDSHNTGAKVTFWLPDKDSLEHFRHLTTRKGKTAGQRFMAVLVQIGDDDQPIEPGTDSRPPRESHALAQSAALLCQEPAFQSFVQVREKWQPSHPEAQVEQAAQYVRDYCRVSSRADLDKSEIAGQLFARLMAEYRDWARATGA